MTLPLLTGWDATAHGLHRAAQFIGGLRMLLLPHMPHYLEVAMKPTADGISTDVLPTGEEVILNFRSASLVYRRVSKPDLSFPLAGQTQANLGRALLGAMDREGRLSAHLAQSQADADLLIRFRDAVRAKYPTLPEHHTQFEGDTPLNVDVQLAADYAEAIYTVFTGIARFRARLIGHMTPLVIWMEGFDLSGLWFREGDMDDSKAQMNFGFAPFSRGFDRPYLYATAYPYSGKTPPVLPSPAYWNVTGWKGVVVGYDDIARADDPAAFVEQICLAIFPILSDLLA